MCDTRLYELLPLFPDDEMINLHVQLSVGECTICRSALDMKKESSSKRRHDILWRVSLYNRVVKRIRHNVDCTELWLERDDRE